MGIPVYQNSGSYSGVDNSSPVVVPMPASISSGDLLIMTVQLWSRASSTITVPSGWTSIINNTFTIGADIQVNMICYRIADGTEGPSVDVTFSGSGSQAGGICHRFTGADTTSPIESSSSGTGGSGTSGSIPAGSTSSNNCLILGIGMGFDATFSTISVSDWTDYTERSDVSDTSGVTRLCLAMGSQDKASSGSFGADSITYSTNMNTRREFYVVIKEAAGAAPSVIQPQMIL